jgi:hypothetical protein
MEVAKRPVNEDTPKDVAMAVAASTTVEAA